MKRNFKWMLVAILTISGAISVYAQSSYTFTRISNPELGVGELDGFIAGGVHNNDYTTSMAMRGDDIFIASTRNLGSGWVNIFTPKCDFWGIFGDVVQGIYPRDAKNDGSNIIVYNRKDGSFNSIYKSENTVSYRSAVTFQNKVFFGAYSADPDVNPYILKAEKNDKGEYEFTKVFETRDCSALRANCIFDDHLFFAGADEREEVTGKAAKLAVLRKSGGDDTAWNRVADYKDFGEVAYDEIFNTWIDAPIWSLASHNGYIYATVPSSKGFVVFRGHPAATGETANKYGWYWEKVPGSEPGLEAREASPLGSLCGSLYEFNGKLYAYNFDRSILGELSVFLGGVRSLTELESATALDYLNFIYALLKTQQKVWCLDDATDKFELQKSFSQNMLNTISGRVGEYDGQLYIGSIDPGHLYSWASLLASDGIFELTPSEIISKITSLSKTIGLLRKSRQQDQTLIDKLEQLRTILSQFLVCDIVNAGNISDILSSTDLQSLIELIRSLNTNPDVTVSWDYKNLLDLIMKLIQDKLNGTTTTIPDIDIPDLTDILDYKTLLEDIVKLIQDRLGDNAGNIPDIPGITDLLNLILERLNGNTGDTPDYSDLTALIELLLERLGNNAGTTPDYSSLLDLIKKLLGNIDTPDTHYDYNALLDLIQRLFGGNTGTGDYTSLLDLIKNILLGNTGDDTTDLTAILEAIRNALTGSGDTGNILRDLLLGALAGNILDNVQALLNGLNEGGLSNYAYLFERMRANKMGCDIMRTADGVNFEFITRDGLGDKYNYGCPSFVAADNGLYIATSNSFFGGQLWLMTNDGTPGTNWATEDDADAIQTITGTATQSGYYTLDGRRVNGKPQKGIYIYNGKKIAVK